jgi:hypothetical protein
MWPINLFRQRERHDFSTVKLLNSADHNNSMTKHGITKLSCIECVIVRRKSHKMEISQSEECFIREGVKKVNVLFEHISNHT